MTATDPCEPFDALFRRGLVHAKSTPQRAGSTPTGARGLRVDSNAQAEQVRSVSVDRLGPVLGLLAASLVAAVDDALRLQLDL